MASGSAAAHEPLRPLYGHPEYVNSTIETGLSADLGPVNPTIIQV